ncbi:MAG: hypothetical protein ACTSWN_17410 [Promethearchaeota archaeon]
MIKNKDDVRKVAFVQGFVIILVISLFFTTVALIKNPSDYLPDRIAREDRKGMMYGYVFVSWEDFMHTSVAGEYMDLIAQCLDFCFVHAQWSVIGVDNNTLNMNYLGNLTDFIRAMGSRGVQVVVHVWVSSYSPTWMYQYTPELVGQPDRWAGIPPNTTNETAMQHRNALKWSMIHYIDMLCQYLVDQGLSSNILGFCLDDETQSEYWLDFFAAITTVIHSFNSSWETMAMFNRPDKYHMTGDAGMDVNAMDPYDQDTTLVQKITYAYHVSGVDKISVLLDAMYEHDDSVNHRKMRRQAWISWFMGADSIGWYTFMYPTDRWACVINGWKNGSSPQITNKTWTAIETAKDIRYLNQAQEKINNANDSEGKEVWVAKLKEAYELAKINRFSSARKLVLEVVNS